MALTLPSLPLEIQQQIAAHVEAAHQPSVYAFGLTSKACYAASTFLIYRKINITVRDRQGLQLHVDRLLEAFSRTNSTHHVRCIVLKGALRLEANKSNSRRNRKPWWAQSGLENILEDEEPIEYSGRHVVHDQSVIEKYSDEDLAWAPVVSLLQAIPHLQLKDLIYDCQNQFPPSLLKILHEQHPKCRLHHLTFRFRTLLWAAPHPYEMELATSLYRVKVACSRRDTVGDDDFNLEAIMELAAGLAPNLKDVTVLGLQPALANRHMHARDSWQGLPGHSTQVGSLTSLTLRGFSDLDSPTLLQNWAQHTDFSCLQHLTLGGCYDAKTSGLTGETMEWVASQDLSFSQLRTLSVYLYRDDTFGENPNYSENAVSFFQKFESSKLEELSVTGPMDSLIVDTIMSHLGKTLKKLSLHPYEDTSYNDDNRIQREMPMEFPADRLQQIQAEFPALEELAIPVKRNKSSASETELYRCFAKMQSLKSLFLTLDCSNWRVAHDSAYNPQFDDEEDQKPVESESTYLPQLKRGTLKETFINCAVDEALARSIWEVISKNKTGRRLERLKLWTTGGKDFGRGESSSMVTDLLDNLSRSWLIERGLRDDQEDDITVRELGQHEREARDANVRERDETEPQKIFRQVWPPKEGTESWQDDWSSFPLQV